MIRKLSQQFSASRHRKVSSNSLFNVHQGKSESLRSYLARFNECTIKVSNPNQELFVAAFQNGLRAGQFNELLAQKPADSMEEVISRAEYYIKGKESNAEKRAQDAKEKAPSADTMTFPQAETGELSKDSQNGSVNRAVTPRNTSLL